MDHETKNEPIVVRAGEARELAYGGVRVRFLLESAHGGAVSVCTFHAAPGASGPPMPHHHTREESTFFVTAGRLAIGTRDGRMEIGAGDLVHLRRGVDFTWRNASRDEPVAFTCVYAPAGFEGMLVDIVEALEGRPLEPESMRRVMPPLWRAYGIEAAETS